MLIRQMVQLGLTVAGVTAVGTGCVQRPTHGTTDTSGYVACPDVGSADLVVSIVAGQIVVAPNAGDVTVRSGQVIRWFAARPFRIKPTVKSGSVGSGADPGTMPGWSGSSKTRCYKVGTGPYELKYRVGVSGSDDLDPRIIIQP